ncbi:GntR family transcriptional regulator [Psychrobium sp. MM17-31]|uniref:GntR family transcriptional regulator n=1 Tax=Psychrobium sp. MM17-31 TaxID=2917758 RepID=UPI001EF6F665|nr:GntR family transcriptional regulator [Psychrobium sp. MM17-31]
MEIIINVDDETPLFSQLVEQIKQAVMTGHLGAGDPLPSIRQLANDLAINNKTVAKAYRLLERDNVIETKGYRGTFVHPNAAQNSQVDINEAVTEVLQQALTNLKALGATDSEIRIAFSRLMNQ